MSDSLVKDMVKALGALGDVEVATRLMASGVKSALAGVTVLSGGLAAPLTALGYGAIGLAQGATAASTSYVLGRAASVATRARPASSTSSRPGVSSSRTA